MAAIKRQIVLYPRQAWLRKKYACQIHSRPGPNPQLGPTMEPRCDYSLLFLLEDWIRRAEEYKRSLVLVTLPTTSRSITTDSEYSTMFYSSIPTLGISRLGDERFT